MKYSQSGFRPFYNRFLIITDNHSDDGVLAYGYIDHEAGMSFKAIAKAQRRGNGYIFTDIAENSAITLRAEILKNAECIPLGDKLGKLAETYLHKCNPEAYEVSEEIEQTRNMTFLDACRHPYCIDDVLVYLLKDDNEPEGCWVRIEGLGDHYFIGTLLNEPDQDFGYHCDDTVAFVLQKKEDGTTVCISDMNSDMKLTEKDLEDGTMLEHAVHVFHMERTNDHLIDILELMRDSSV